MGGRVRRLDARAEIDPELEGGPRGVCKGLGIDDDAHPHVHPLEIGPRDRYGTLCRRDYFSNEMPVREDSVAPG